MQPGETITPGTEPTTEPKVESQQAVSQGPQELSSPQQDNTSAIAPPSVEQATSAPETGWQYSGESADINTVAATPVSQPVKWTASEYIAHQKGLVWFALLGLALFVLIGAVFLFTRDILASILVGVAGLTFGVFAARPPRVLDYSVDDRGIQIGQKFYPYHDFKSFAIVDEGPVPSVMLVPLKRFMPPITVYYAPTEEDAILNVLANYLPHEEKQPDAVDRLMSKIRF